VEIRNGLMRAVKELKAKRCDEDIPQGIFRVFRREVALKEQL